MYIIRDRETGTEIDRYKTLKAAEQTLAYFEELDKLDGSYTPDFYEIVFEPHKDHHFYTKQSIGGSDYATLVMMPCTGAPQELPFGEDGEYDAYIVDNECVIPRHYTKVLATDHWLKIYDDDSLAAEFRGEQINVYRAGARGCIIQVID